MQTFSFGHFSGAVVSTTTGPCPGPHCWASGPTPQLLGALHANIAAHSCSFL